MGHSRPCRGAFYYLNMSQSASARSHTNTHICTEDCRARKKLNVIEKRQRQNERKEKEVRDRETEGQRNTSEVRQLARAKKGQTESVPREKRGRRGEAPRCAVTQQSIHSSHY